MFGDRSGKCVNIGNCSLADKREVIVAKAGRDFVCSECGKSLIALTPATAGSSSRRNAILGIGAVALFGLIGGGVALRSCSGPGDNSAETTSPARSTTVASAPGVSVPPVPSSEPLLRLGGSNTIGAKLGPALLVAYFKESGCSDVKSAAPAADESVVSCSANGKNLSATVSAHGSSTAFRGLDDKTLDIGMASRRVTRAEAEKLKALGDMTSPANEHVLGLDGIAVIVHPGNRAAKLTVDQVAAIFSGVINDWKQLGGNAGKINVYARDDRSGTFDTFKALVLDKTPLITDAKRFEDSAALSAAVANDPDGIGFVGLSTIGSAKAVAVGPTGATSLLPNRFTVATEDYALSRRLFFYTAQSSNKPDVARFIEFANSAKGQAVVEQTGLVPLTIRQERSAVPTGAPSAYNGLVANALRLSVNFRFRTGSSEFDNRSLKDLDRVTEFLASSSVNPDRLMLFGFADSRGAATLNQTLSENRAKTVAAALAQRGVEPKTVRGFGSAIPVADNATAEGQDKNRRVEVWVAR